MPKVIHRNELEGFYIGNSIVFVDSVNGGRVRIVVYSTDGAEPILVEKAGHLPDEVHEKFVKRMRRKRSIKS